MRPLISIVIANYNYGCFLEEAIQSVLSQSCKDFELIIIDGGSTDNSVDIIRKYAGGLRPGNDKFERRVQRTGEIAWWVSEKDKGQSDAFNKGFAHARGRFLTWLNADDVLLPGALEAIKCEIERHPKVRWFVGGSVWCDVCLKLQRCFRAHRFSRLRADTGSLMVGGPSSFFEKSLLDEVGGVDINLHYVMDVDLWYRFYRQAGQIYYRTKKYVWAFRIHEDSKMSGPTLNPTSVESKKKRERLAEEGKRLVDLYGFCKNRRLQRLGVYLSVSIVDLFVAKWDEWRCRGMDVREVV